MNFTANAVKQKSNTTGLAVVALLHLVLGGLILQGSKISIARPPALVDVTMLPPPEVTPPQQPRVTEMALPTPPQPPVFVPLQEVPLVIDNPTPIASTTHVAEPAERVVPAAGGGVGPALVETGGKADPVRVAPMVEASACAKPDYPAASARNGDTGVVTLSLLVGTDGRVADSKVERSSGFRELDRAARTGLSLCRFKPGTIDGVPYQSWTRMQYVWSLN